MTREGVAELVNRIGHLKEANARLEARVRLLTEEMEKAKERHEEYRKLVVKLRDDKQTTQANWAFRSIEDSQMKSNAANAVEQLLGEIAVAQSDLENERRMLDWLADSLEDACIEDDGSEVDPAAYMNEETVETFPQAWRIAITKHLERKAGDGHPRTA